MDKQEIAKMKRKVAALQRQLAKLGPVMRGSVVIIGTRNKQSYFSLNKNGKTHLIYLGKEREQRAREYSANYAKTIDIIEEMTIITMKLLKEKACL